MPSGTSSPSKIENKPYSQAANHTDNTLLAGLSPRNWVQLGVLAVCLAIGVQFYVFVEQASGGGQITVPRPAGVEGFLPIGGLMGWKLFALTGIWDPVHPAAMVILGYAAMLSLLLRKSFCGWFCPVGTVSEWLWRLGRRLFGRNITPPRWLDIPLRGLKYLLLGFFLWIIGSMGAREILTFMDTPYYVVADVKMLHFFTRISAFNAAVIGSLVLLSLIIKNFWCRYLCPYGALMGLFSLASPTRIRRDKEACLNCASCAKACPSRLPVDRKTSIMSAECMGCMECTRACPKPGTLRLSAGQKGRGWRPRNMGLAIVLSFVCLVYLATMAGLWQAGHASPRYLQGLKMVETLKHP